MNNKLLAFIIWLLAISVWLFYLYNYDPRKQDESIFSDKIITPENEREITIFTNRCLDRFKLKEEWRSLCKTWAIEEHGFIVINKRVNINGNAL